MSESWWPALTIAALALAALALRDLLRKPGGRAEAAAAPSLLFQASGPFQRLLGQPLQRLLLTDRETHAVRRDLVRAGFYSPHAVAAYYAARLLLGGALPMLINPLASAVGGAMAVGHATVIALSAALFGYLLPAAILGRRIRRRQRKIRKAFPDALDLLVICVEAGLGLDAAMARVGQEIAAAHPLLGEHFAILSAELQAGRRHDEAWRAMGNRIGLDEVSSLVTLLAQSERLGTGAADALRAHARTWRSRRLLQAEEKAQQLGVKMTFPLVLLIMPALMLVIATPAMIRTYRQLIPIFQGQMP